MKILRIITSWVAGCLVLVALVLPAVSAQQVCPFKIHLVADNTSYGANEPIKVQVRVFNDTLQPVITRKGFFKQNFYMFMTFTDSHGNQIRYRFIEATHMPGPPIRYQGRDAVLAEVVPPKGDPSSETLMVIGDAHAHYKLPLGPLTAQVLVPAEIFSEYVSVPGGAILAFLDDPQRQGYNPLVSNKIRFKILPPEPVAESSIRVVVKHLKIGEGTSPGTSKEPLRGATVKLFLRSAVPADYHPINWKTYFMIWDNVPVVSSQTTDSNGIAKFENIPRDDYLVLAKHRISADFKHMGSPIGSDDPDWLTELPIEKHLMVMEKSDGHSVPGKTTRRKGSDLLITEPEYIEWDSTQEVYPFVFETIGDWGVTTLVNPPEGFVADFESLSAEVSNEIEAVQFTITDVGSKWKETEVEYEIKHKKKTEKIKSKIGVKLSKKRAKEEGLGIYGHTPEPGPFKGWKKVGH